MADLQIFDRNSKTMVKEPVFGMRFLKFLYSKSAVSKGFLFFIARYSLLSSLIGKILRMSFSKRWIRSFIHDHHIDASEFEEAVEKYDSFNDFFIRKLNPLKRPIETRKNVAVLPADARYLAFESIDRLNHLYIKGQKFSVSAFLQDEKLAKSFEGGPIVIARLAPSDCHRFFFPFDCTPSKPKLINGHYYSVNPIALAQNFKIFSENKREVTILHSETFSDVAFIEVGATNVGSIHQTFSANQRYEKGEEKGYFSFGGSTIVLLFQKNKIQIDKDLIDKSKDNIEARGLYGQSLGRLV